MKKSQMTCYQKVIRHNFNNHLVYKDSRHMKLYSFILSLLLFVIMLTSCNTSKKSLEVGEKCDHRAIVKDFQDLDACRFLLSVSDTLLLLPVNLPPDAPEMKDGDKWRISYKIVDGASACMAESHMAQLTCFEILKN